MRLNKKSSIMTLALLLVPLGAQATNSITYNAPVEVKVTNPPQVVEATERANVFAINTLGLPEIGNDINLSKGVSISETIRLSTGNLFKPPFANTPEPPSANRPALNSRGQ